MEKWKELTKKIHSASHIALLMHVSPDGDTCGSALALYRGCVYLGKEAAVICDSAVPAIFSSLPGADRVMRPGEAPRETFDLCIAVDVGDRGRLGQCAALFDAAKHTAQIDHHGTNPGYAEHNVIRSPLSATGILAAELLEALGIPMDAAIAECLYVAVSSDTGNFTQQNTDEAAFALAARCLSAGFPLHAVARRIFCERPLCQSRLIGRALSEMEMLEAGTIALMTLSLVDFEETGALPEHTEGIIDFAVYTAGVQIACLITERSDFVKCSFRAQAPHNVAHIAKAFGGGGHDAAAGCTVSLALPEARKAVKAALCAEFAR